MFEFLFNYPRAVFSRGELILLGGWPRWVLWLLIVAIAAGLAYLIRARISGAPASLKNWRMGAIWLIQSCVAALVLLLLWQPALTVAELKPQQNIIAVLVDDSRSMGLSENGTTRVQQAVKALQGGVLDTLQRKFQTRVYRVDSNLTQATDLKQLQPSAPATHIGGSLDQLVAETSGLPIGAVVLLSDGGDNSGGIDSKTIAALRSRKIPVHTVGFGPEQMPSDVEIDDAVIAPRALADSRMTATVTFHEQGFSGQKATLTAREGEKVLASKQITFSSGGKIQSENLPLSAGEAGAKTIQFSIDAMPGETNKLNNAVTRLVNVESDKRRILYVEGEPRWEYKFIRRAEDDDRIVQVASMLRTTENKIYRQGIDDPKELADGFPTSADELFRYQGMIIGSVDVDYFTPAQQDMIKQFVDRRGGGLLLLGGRFALADGGWAGSNLADLLPATLPNHKNTFHRAPATAELTPIGVDSNICKLLDDPTKNAEKWKTLPYLMDYQEVGEAKPGAAVLAMMKAGGRQMPLLMTENYGRGRTAILATSGTWRWQMSLPLGDMSHDMFWRQLLRWVVADTPGQVVASVPQQIVFDDGHIQLSADVRDKQYLPAPDATVEANILGPDGISATVQMSPVPDSPGKFQADWTAGKAGSYLTEVTARRGDQEVGKDVLTFQRMDGVAENFHTGQNRDLLEKLASQTGGEYRRPQDLSKLASDIPYSDAGVTVRETKPLWNMPAAFLLIVGLVMTEWLLRRKWGIV
jgi:uncharacterized membrane protein